jgi:hypothetical protein
MNFADDPGIDDGLKIRVRRIRELMKPYPEKADDFDWLIAEIINTIGQKQRDAEHSRLAEKEKVKKSARKLAAAIHRLLVAERDLRKSTVADWFDVPIDHLPIEDLERIKKQADDLADQKHKSKPTKAERKKLAAASVIGLEGELIDLCRLDDPQWPAKLAIHLAEPNHKTRPDLLSNALRDIQRYINAARNRR